MHRTESTGATATNQFTNGNPATGVPPTQLDDDWLNAVQEELSGVILAAGLALETKATDTHDQLLAALRNKTTGINAGKVNDLPANFTSALAAAGHQALPSGLILQWGTVVVNNVANANVAWTFVLPIAFPAAVLQAWACPGNNLAGSPVISVEDLTNPAQVSGFARSTDAVARTYRIFALGN